MYDFAGWIPLRMVWRAAVPHIDWVYLGERRFTEPFFSQTLDRCLQTPADLLFRRQTPLDHLGEIAAAQPSVAPTGFIFHMSRCGSTLLSQMLAAVRENIVLSEAAPMDSILRARLREPNLDEAQQVQWLRWLVAVLGWQREPAERNLFIKFDSWHTLFLPLIERACPGVPWLFVFREPAEVLVSHLAHRGAQMLPGVLEPELFGWDAAEVARMTLNEYGARVLGKICEAALARVNAGSGKLVNYRQLPDSAWPHLMAYWRAEFSTAETARMFEAAQRNAKNPVLTFAPDSAAKRAAAQADLLALSRQWLDPVYHDLEAQRLTCGFA